RLRDQLLGEKPIALQEIGQRPFRVACLLRDFPQCSTVRKSGTPKLWGWREPDGLVSTAQQRRDQSRQQPKSLHHDQRLLRQRQQIVHDQLKPFAPKPWERREHLGWRVIYPALVHVRQAKRLEQRGFSRVCSGNMARDGVVGGIE